MENNNSVQEEKSTKESLGCSHYRRNCQFISPCCNKKYVCRVCHDDNENHKLNRKEVQQVECLVCHEIQPVSEFCRVQTCKIKFGYYFCAICRLYDNEDKKQYHCDGCGLCRIGGRDKYFHCNKCQMCMPYTVQETHKCIEEVSQRDCAVCLEDIHTSRVVSHIPPCGHLLHSPCYQSLLDTGFMSCPTCGQSLANFDFVWKQLDEEIASTPLTDEMANIICKLLCKDCHQESSTPFHPIGLKCGHCGSYNTAKIGQEMPTLEESNGNQEG